MALFTSRMKRRFLLFALCANLGVVQLLHTETITQPLHASAANDNGNGNSGDVKISETTQPANGNQGNEPHVGCQFYVLGFNMAASMGNITVRAWDPTSSSRDIALTDTYPSADTSLQPADRGNIGFVSGPHSLPAGHYKLFVTDNKGNDIAKQKVFWVDQCPTELPVTSTPIPPTDTPVPPTSTPVPPTDTPIPPTSTPTPGLPSLGT